MAGILRMQRFIGYLQQDKQKLLLLESKSYPIPLYKRYRHDPKACAFYSVDATTRAQFKMSKSNSVLCTTRDPLCSRSHLRRQQMSLERSTLHCRPACDSFRTAYALGSPRQGMSLQSARASSSHVPPAHAHVTSLSEAKYEQLADLLLEQLSEQCEELLETLASQRDSDVALSSGVLTLQLGTSGTYVINKQTPNLQIWLSSPRSGPKRFDYVDGAWLYKHSGEELLNLLSLELSDALGVQCKFTQEQ